MTDTSQTEAATVMGEAVLETIIEDLAALIAQERDT